MQPAAVNYTTMYPIDNFEEADKAKIDWTTPSYMGIWVVWPVLFLKDGRNVLSLVLQYSMILYCNRPINLFLIDILILILIRYFDFFKTIIQWIQIFQTALRSTTT